jgi:hypothetical protein
MIKGHAMLIRFILLLCAVVPGAVMADAADGDFMGYRLGDRYQRSADMQQQTTATGNLLIVAADPVKPADIAVVTLLTTPESLTIGYIAAAQWFQTEEEARAMGRKYVDLLRAKYPDWAFGREGMDSNLKLIEVNLDNAPHNLRLRLDEGKHDDTDMWRFSMTLGWMQTSAEEQVWRDRAVKELSAAQQDGTDKLLQDSDTRGL